MQFLGKTSLSWLDLKVLFLTVKKVVVRDGISGEGETTMSKFTGNKD